MKINLNFNVLKNTHSQTMNTTLRNKLTYIKLIVIYLAKFFENKLKNIALLLLVLFATQAESQTLDVNTDKQQLAVGESFQLKYSVQNLDMTAFTPPSFSDFEVVSGPNRLSSVQIINGKATRKSAISYELRAKKIGRFTINSANLLLTNNRQLFSEKITIEVTTAPQSIAPPTSGERNDVFVRATISKNDAFVGQQLILEYKIYTAASFNGAQLLREATYKGFYHHELTEFSRDDQMQVIGKKRYLIRTLGRIALFPQESGNLIIEPLVMQVGILKTSNSQDPFSGIFPEVEPTQVISNALTINVKSLPAPMPTYFVGAVGRCELSASINKTQATTDDALAMHVTIKSNGDPKRIHAPQLLPVDGMTFYEPKILSERSFEQQGELITIKEIEYLILPKVAKQYSFKPEFAFFDLQKQDLQKIQTPTFELQISQGTNSAAQVSAIQQATLAPIKTATIFQPNTEGGQFTGSWLYFVLLCVPFLAFMSVLSWKERQKRLRRVDENILKIQNAEKIARQRLILAKEMLQRKSSKGFYDEVSRSLYGYTSDKLGIPPSEFSKEALYEKLLTAQVRPDLVENVLDVLKKCEFALFAGTDTEGGAMLSVYEQTVKVITDMEQDFKKVNL